MDTIEIFKRNAFAKKTSFIVSEYNGCVIDSMVRNEYLDGSDVITLRFDSRRDISIDVGDYIVLDGMRFYINTPIAASRVSDSNYNYTIKFTSVVSLISNYKFIGESENYLGGVDFNVFGNIETHIAQLLFNLKRSGLGYTFELGAIDYDLDKELNINYSNLNCLEAINKICSEEFFNTRFYFEVESNKVKLNISHRKAGFNSKFKYGEYDGLVSVTKEPISTGAKITRLYVSGSDRNIPPNYGSPNLMLPNSKKYVESDLSSGDIVNESYKKFEDIYPSRLGVITGVTDDPKVFIDAQFELNLNQKDIDGNYVYLVGGEVVTINFLSGNLQGYSFEVSDFELLGGGGGGKFVLKPSNENPDISIPSNEDAYRIKKGDKYVITGIRLPDSYIIAAEHRLLSKAREYLREVNKKPYRYSIELDPLFVKNIDSSLIDKDSDGILKPTSRVFVSDENLGIDEKLEVMSKETKIFERGAYLEGQISLSLDYISNLNVEDAYIKPTIVMNGVRVMEWDVGGQMILVNNDEEVTVYRYNKKPYMVSPRFLAFSGNLGKMLERVIHQFKIYKDGVLIKTTPPTLLDEESPLNTPENIVWINEYKGGNAFPSDNPIVITKDATITYELWVSDGVSENTASFDVVFNVIQNDPDKPNDPNGSELINNTWFYRINGSYQAKVNSIVMLHRKGSDFLRLGIDADATNVSIEYMKSNGYEDSEHDTVRAFKIGNSFRADFSPPRERYGKNPLPETGQGEFIKFRIIAEKKNERDEKITSIFVLISNS